MAGDESSTSNALSIGIPIATFVLGLAAGYVEKFRESRRRRSNTRLMFFKELRNNFSRLNEIWPPDDNLASVAPNADIVAEICRDFSMAVYGEYLGRLDSLTSGEVDALFEAYFNVQQAIDAGGKFSEANTAPTEVRAGQIQNAAGAVLFTSDNALTSMEAALNTLPGRSQEVQALLQGRGTKLERLAAVRHAIDVASDAGGADSPKPM